jgi:hypothetical protein
MTVGATLGSMIGEGVIGEGVIGEGVIGEGVIGEGVIGGGVIGGGMMIVCSSEPQALQNSELSGF